MPGRRTFHSLQRQLDTLPICCPLTNPACRASIEAKEPKWESCFFRLFLNLSEPNGALDHLPVWRCAEIRAGFEKRHISRRGRLDRVRRVRPPLDRRSLLFRYFPVLAVG